MTDIQGNLFSRLRRGLGAQGFSQLVQIFIRLAEVPLLLAFWGSRLYGEWLMVAAIPAFLAMSDGGFAGAASREMAMRSGAGDRLGTLAVFQSIWALLLVVSAGLFFVAAGVVEALPLGTWLGFEEISAASLKVILLLLIVHVLVGFQGGLLYGGFWCSGRYPLGMTWMALTYLFEFVGLVVAVILGGGPVEAAAGFLAGRVMGTIILWLTLRGATPWLKFGFSKVSTKEIRRLTPPAFASLAFPLGNALNIQGMRLVVGLVLGPAAVAVFAPIRTLTRLALQPMAIINSLIQPEMGTAFGKGDTVLFARLFARSCQASVWLCLAGCLALVAIGNWLLPLWTAGKVEMHWPLFLLLLGAVAINATWYTALMVPYATNRHGRIAVFYSAIYGATAFVLAYAGAIFFGYVGVGAALLFVEAVMAVYVVLAALKLSGQLWRQWIRAVMCPPWWLFKYAVDSSYSVQQKGNI
jgi:O-antigen/teichoic acid export membrane protein